MQLRRKSRGSSVNWAAKVKDATDVVLGTGPESAGKEFDSRSGCLLSFILLFVIGWIPTLGQAVAGYVGGRRSGSPYRGFAATFIATVLALAIMTCISLGLETFSPDFYKDPMATVAEATAISPILGESLNGVLMYVKHLFGATNYFEINYGIYLITIGFGVIGGVIADQNKKEARLIIQKVDRASMRRYRSMESYAAGSEMGFKTYDDTLGFTVNSKPLPVRKKQEIQPDVVSTVADAVTAEPIKVETIAPSVSPTSSEPSSSISLEGLFRSRVKRKEPDTESSEEVPAEELL